MLVELPVKVSKPSRFEKNIYNSRSFPEILGAVPELQSQSPVDNSILVLKLPQLNNIIIIIIIIAVMFYCEQVCAYAPKSHVMYSNVSRGHPLFAILLSIYQKPVNSISLVLGLATQAQYWMYNTMDKHASNHLPAAF